MGRESRRYRRFGRVPVRITADSHSGITLLAVSWGPEPDRFLTEEGKILLAKSAVKLTHFLQRDQRHSLAGDAQLRSLLAVQPVLKSRRWFSFERCRRMLVRPIHRWQWSYRGVVLDRLEFLWDMAESLESEDVKNLLGRTAPLGKLADASFEELGGDLAYRQLLRDRVDLSEARNHLERILASLDRALLELP